MAESKGARPRRRAILVLGMHRSGTSALTRVLSLLGAELPKHVMPANTGNPTGYWEPEPIVAFNDEVLRFFGTAWDDPFAPFQLPAAGDFPARFRKRALDLLEAEFEGADLFVLKDPRCTLLAGFWRSVLEGAGIECIPVMMMRPPGEVAESLRRRDGMSASFANLLVVTYFLECIAFDARHDTTVLTYAQLLDDWKAVTDRIAADHGLTWPIVGAMGQARIEEFLQPAARTPRQPALPSPLAGWVAEAWEWVECRAAGRRVAPPEGVREELQAASAIVSPALAWRTRQLEALSGTLEERRQAESDIQADRDRALAQLRAIEGEHDALANAHRLLVEERDGLSRQVAAVAGQRDEFHADRDRALDRLRSLETEHETTGRTLRALEEENGRLGRHVGAVEAQRDELRADRDRALEQLQSLEREHAALATHMQSIEAQRDEFRVDRDRALEQLRSLEREHEALAKAHGVLNDEQAALAMHARSLEGQRDEFQVDRDRALAQLHDLERDHDKAQATLQASERDRAEAVERVARLEKELEELGGERERIAGVLADAGRAMEEVQAALQERDAHAAALAGDREHLLAEHSKLCNLHEQALLRIERATRRAAELEDALAAERRAVEEIHASTSWRMTAPLRGVREASRRLLKVVPGAAVLAGSQLRLPAPLAPAPGAVPEDTKDPDRHAGLRAWLVEEFGAERATAITARIDRYGLDTGTAEGRAATEASCDPADAVRSARKLAVRAANAGLGQYAPDVSIILPVYNQVSFTLACIDALVAHESRYRFEVLVGDDASTDATAEALGVGIPGVRHVRHASNLGFVRNCNATAAQASGRFVLFLNNDTQVLPGWLDELVGTLERDSGIGLAGSKLVYPDGRLQECGAIVWQDGSAWNLGRFDDPRRPEYSYLRDCDYVSGASIALSRELWEQLQGFDEMFVPAYAEDADLAFRMRAAGLRTVVQPLSQLLHFEGVSSGTDTSRGVKAHQVENLRKLRERWQHDLATHRPNAEAPELEKERGVRKRVLFIDHCTPTPHEDAGSQVAWEVMSAFREEGYKVTFIPEDNFAYMGADTRALQRVGIEAIYHPSYSSMPAFLAARNDPFDVVFLHRYGVGEAHLHDMRRHFPGARVLFLNADMHFLREMREAEMSGDAAALAAARRTRSRELAVIRGVDATLVHSDAEVELLAQECPDTPVTLFPLIHDPVPLPVGLALRSGVCFVGGFRHPPNADGITWFADEVWPIVLAARPDATLRIAGSHMTADVLALGERRNVEVVGFVDDLETFLAGHRLSVAPLRYGAGAKGKVAESLAHGLPVVGTPIATEGMQLTPGGNVLVGESPQALADAIITVLDDDALWNRLSAAGLAYADEVTSRRHARHRIHALLEQVATDPPVARPAGA